MSRQRVCTTLISAAAVLAACSPDTAAPAVVNLERPASMAFACFGDYRLASDSSTLVTAQPVESCAIYRDGGVPTGQEDLIAPEFAGFVLQPSTGSVAVVKFPANLNGFSTAAVIDADLLTPGKNAIPVGTLPVSIASDPQGCHVVTANAGSCDLSVLDVNTALQFDTQARVDRIPITTSTGSTLLARPRVMVGEPAGGVIGEACPATPQGLVYIAYPECNLVAAVDSGTGVVQAGLRFETDGTVTITDGDVSCAAQCGGGTAPTITTAERPVALHMADDGGRLYIGAENSAALTIVDLDADRKPTAVTRLTLEGEIGITALRATGDVEVGGDSGTFGGPLAAIATHRYVYAVATDRTVRVIEVQDKNVECDTQVDPRAIADETDVEFLACMPVGDVRTPARRPGARSPGIHMPREAVPLDVAFTQLTDSVDVDFAQPTQMVGVFAFVTTSDGFAFVVNVDDDRYPDVEDPADPMKVFMPLAIPHQLRDFAVNRQLLDGQSADGTAAARCIYPAQDVLALGPRLNEPVGVFLPSGDVSSQNVHHLPNIRHDLCKPSDDPLLDTPMAELSYGAQVSTREAAYPDLAATRNEGWTITWEGLISLDPSSTRVDGPPTRIGVLEFGSEISIVDTTGPYCAMGVEKYDIVQLVGCDPGRGDADCGLGETCFVHPDSPASIGLGLCLPADETDALSAVCRDVLVSRRRYSITKTRSRSLVLGERRRVLSTTPVAGCTDAAQCDMMAVAAAELATAEHPNQRTVEVDERSWACEADPTRAPGINRCVMTCESASDCEEGWHCSASKRCVEAPLPPAECLAGLQRYQVRVGDAFAVIGELSGFLHGRKVDENTGECIDDPDAHPLMVGRLPLTAPPCVGDGPNDVSVNPCTTTVEHAELHTPFMVDDSGTCVATTTFPIARTRSDVNAIRFQNPSLRWHLVDPTTTGDAECLGDRQGTYPAFPASFAGFQISMRVAGGYFPMSVTGVNMAFPAYIVPSPDGGLWVMDQGDVFVSGIGTTKGRIVRIEPTAAEAGFSAVTLL